MRAVLSRTRFSTGAPLNLPIVIGISLGKTGEMPQTIPNLIFPANVLSRRMQSSLRARIGGFAAVSHQWPDKNYLP
jgi:hypothetical protein